MSCEQLNKTGNFERYYQCRTSNGKRRTHDIYGNKNIQIDITDTGRYSKDIDKVFQVYFFTKTRTDHEAQQNALLKNIKELFQFIAKRVKVQIFL